jgi:putative membrane protein
MPTAVAIVIRVAVIMVSLWVATALIDGIDLGGGTRGEQFWTLLAVSVIFGVINAVLKPLIKIIGCPLYIITLGLVGLVVNALLFMLVGYLAGVFGLPFVVDGFWAAFWGAIVVGVVGFLVHLVIPDRLDQR